MRGLKEKIFVTLVKDGKACFTKVGATKGGLYPRSRVGISGWEVTKRKH